MWCNAVLAVLSGVTLIALISFVSLIALVAVLTVCSIFTVLAVRSGRLYSEGSPALTAVIGDIPNVIVSDFKHGRCAVFAVCAVFAGGAVFAILSVSAGRLYAE